jgi:rubrerythrin
VGDEQLVEVLRQALQSEIGGEGVYRSALQCAKNELLKAEWTKYLERAGQQGSMTRKVLDDLAFDPDKRLARALKAAFAEIEDQEDERLYQTTGWPANCGTAA